MDKLEKLKQDIQEYQNKSAVTQDLKAFATLFLKVLAEAKSNFSTISSENQAKFDQIINYLDQEHTKLVENVSQVTDTTKKDFENKLTELKDLIKKVQTIKPIDGEDGYTPVKGQDYFTDSDIKNIKDEVLKDIPPVEEETGESIVDKINALNIKPENQIDAKHIKNLPENKVVYTGGAGGKQAYQITVDTTNFNNNLSSADNTVQKALETLDELVGGGGGSWGSITGTLSDQTDLQNALDGKQATLVSGTNIKTINGNSILGSGDLVISGGAVDSVNGQTGTVVLDTDDITDTATNRYTNDTDITRLANTSGTNTGDQDLSSYAPLNSPTFTTSINGAYLTASQLLATDGSKNIVSLSTATYPSLTELSYVKGLTSAVQGQIDGKANTTLSNLGTVAINTTLVSDTDNTDDLGTSSVFWRTGYFKTSIELGATDTTLTRVSAGVVAIEGSQITTLNTVSYSGNQTQTLSVKTRYLLSVGLYETQNMTLPSTFAVGDEIEFTINSTSNAGTVNIILAAGDNFLYVGTDGQTTSTTSDFVCSRNSSFKLVCTVANSTWEIVSIYGSGGSFGGTNISSIGYSIPLSAGDIMFTTAVQTVTNKRIQPRVSSSANGNITPNLDTANYYIRTALSGTCSLGVPTGSPTTGEELLFRFKDNGTARTLSWDAIYRAVGVTIPTTTVISKTLYVRAIYNSTDTKWDVVQVNQEA